MGRLTRVAQVEQNMASLFHDVVAGKVGAVSISGKVPFPLDATKAKANRISPASTFTLSVGEWSEYWNIINEHGHKTKVVIPRNESLWIEGTLAVSGQRKAVHLRRYPHQDGGFAVLGTIWESHPVSAVAIITGQFLARLNELGEFVDGEIGALAESQVRMVQAYMGAAFWICFVTHCKNVRMEPAPAPKARRRWTRDQIPATVWHRISATAEGLPKNLLGGAGIFRDESKFRQYRVRGTIRSAPNHPIPQFRGPFWIPDHWRGNSELGQVIPEYQFCATQTEPSH